MTSWSRLRRKGRDGRDFVRIVEVEARGRSLTGVIRSDFALPLEHIVSALYLPLDWLYRGCIYVLSAPFLATILALTSAVSDSVHGQNRLLRGDLFRAGGFNAPRDAFAPNDEKEVVFATAEPGGKSTVSRAPLDRRIPPSPIASGDQVSFDTDGDLIFRSLKGQDNFVERIKNGQSGPEPLTSAPILEKSGVSPDGEWVIVFLVEPAGTFAIPTRGGPAKKICAEEHCPAMWSSDGKFFYVELPSGKTLAIPVPAGKSLPDLPASGVSAAGGAPQGVQVILHSSISPGLDPSTYVFTKTDLQRNLFRVPLH